LPSNLNTNFAWDYVSGNPYAAGIAATGSPSIPFSGDFVFTTYSSAPVSDVSPPKSPDATPPIIIQQSDIDAQSVSTNGVQVNYQATATDDVDGTVVPTCTPSSGSIFSVGNTTVICNAQDTAGNNATPMSFTVKVTLQNLNPPNLTVDQNNPGPSTTYKLISDTPVQSFTPSSPILSALRIEATNPTSSPISIDPHIFVDTINPATVVGQADTPLTLKPGSSIIQFDFNPPLQLTPGNSYQLFISPSTPNFEWDYVSGNPYAAGIAATGSPSIPFSGDFVFTSYFMPDTTPPDTLIDSGPSGTVLNTNTASFAFHSTKTGSTFQCSIDNSAYTACTTPTTYNNLADGSHTFSVKATDTSGNIDSTPATQTWVVDTIPPDTTIISGPTGHVDSNSESFQFSSTETSSTFQCSLDSSAFVTCSSPTTYSLKAGSHTFSVKATDTAGNTDSTPATQTWNSGHITTTSVSSTASTISVGNTVTYTAIVTDTSSNPTPPVGFVSWDDHSNGPFSSHECSLTITSGSTSQCSVAYVPTLTPIGGINGLYEGDPVHQVSGGSSSLLVTQASGIQTSSAVTPANLIIGPFGTISYTMTVTDSSNSPSPVGGFVTWDDGGAGGSFIPSTCSLSPSTAATCSVLYQAPLFVGNVIITGHYMGSDVNHHASSSNYVFLTVQSPSDADSDGISDQVDTSPSVVSNSFSDISIGGTTTGTITNRGNQLLTVQESYGHIITIRAAPLQVGNLATVNACNGSGQFTLNSGNQVNVFCHSFDAQVINGPVDFTFTANDGTTATASIGTGDSIIFKPDTFTFITPQINPDTIVVQVGNQKILVAPGQTVSQPVTLHDNKDSFLRSGAKNTNEGANTLLM